MDEVCHCAEALTNVNFTLPCAASGASVACAVASAAVGVNVDIGAAVTAGSGVEEGFSVAVAVGCASVAAGLVDITAAVALGAQAVKIKILQRRIEIFFIFSQLIGFICIKQVIENKFHAFKIGRKSLNPY